MKSPLYSTSYASIPVYLEATINQILGFIDEGKYCAVLGPRFSGKTDLLLLIKDSLNQSARTCIRVDLYDVEATTQANFFCSLAKVISREVEEEMEIAISFEPEEVKDSITFRSFMKEEINILKGDLVLVLDHLE